MNISQILNCIFCPINSCSNNYGLSMSNVNVESQRINIDVSYIYPISPRCYYTTIVVRCVNISKHKICIKNIYVAAIFRDVVAIFR